MNLNHLEAIALVQKLAFALNDKDFDKVEVAVLPPFTDLRSVQTLVDGDKLRIVYGAQDLSAARRRRLHRRGVGRDAGQARLHLRAGRPLRAAAVPRRGRRPGQRQGAGGLPALADADPVRGRGAGGAPGGRPRRALRWASSTARCARSPPSRQNRSWSPTSRSGRSAPARWPPRRTPRRSAARCGSRLAELYDAEVASAVRILYGGSVKSGNIAGIMAQPDVDGALVGGASIDAGEFVKICRFSDMPG